MRKHLNADTLLSLVRKDFQKIPDRRADNTKISLDDALMSALAMFQLKDPSLLAFARRRREEPENLHTVFGIGIIPCDSQMRTILMMLAFLIDQVQQLSCWLFQDALKKAESKRYLWESIRAFFHNYRVDSMETILRAIAHGFERRELKEVCRT